MATVIYVMGDRRHALQELPLPEAGLKGREEVVRIQLKTGHKVATCPRRKLLYMWIYVIWDQKLLLRGIFLSIIKSRRGKTETGSHLFRLT